MHSGILTIFIAAVLQAFYILEAASEHSTMSCTDSETDVPLSLLQRGVRPEPKALLVTIRGVRQRFSPPLEHKPVRAMLINLDRRQQKLQAAKSRLAPLIRSNMLRPRLLRATDGVSEEVPAEAVAKTIPGRFPMNLTAGERGCAMSHVRAWQQIADRLGEDDDSPVLVMHDDVAFRPEFDVMFRTAHELLSFAGDADLLHLQSSPRHTVRLGQHVADITGTGAIYEAQFTLGGPAYLLWPSGAKKLLKALPVNLPVDAFIGRQMQLGKLNSFVVEPPLVYAEESADTDVKRSVDDLILSGMMQIYTREDVKKQEARVTRPQPHHAEDDVPLQKADEDAQILPPIIQEVSNVTREQLMEQANEQADAAAFAEAKYQAIIINLGQRSDRIEKLQTLVEPWVESHFLGPKLFPATDGNYEEIPDYAVTKEWRGGVKDKLRLSPGERGCAMSHFRAWKEIASGVGVGNSKTASSAPVMVLEDDVFLPKNFPDIFSAAVQAVQNITGGADVLYLGYETKKAQLGKSVTQLSGSTNIKEAKLLLKSFAYVLWPSSANKLINAAPIDMPVDVFIATHIQSGTLRGFALDPPLASEEDQKSDVQHSLANLDLEQLQKLGFAH